MLTPACWAGRADLPRGRDRARCGGPRADGVAAGPTASLSPIRCEADTTDGPPQPGRRVALGPIRLWVARHEGGATRTIRRERQGRRLQAAARATTSRGSQTKTCPANTYYHPHTAFVNASSTKAGIVPGGGPPLDLKNTSRSLCCLYSIIIRPVDSER